MSSQQSKDVCSDCRNKVKKNEEGLKCDECDMWYHAMCQKISKGTYRALREHEELMWQCNNCKHELKCSKNKMKDLEERNKMLNEKLREIEEKWSKMRAEIVEEVLRKVKNEIMDEVVSTVNNKVSQNDFGNVGQNQVEVVKSKVLQELEEEEEKRRRVCNLVIYNVPESEREEAEERKTEDTNWCQDIFRNSLELDQIEMEQVIRLGKRNEGGRGRPRPVLIKFKNEEMKWKILKSAKKLKHEQNPLKKRVGITKDMTKKEREAMAKLREELKEKQDNGENGWMIKNGKLLREQGARERR
ncbi:uncharacterized protein PF3D7_1120000-like [Palaemon carinicauda]|uniref:uncharacterized protein PF3D7_1120000-like n=1 Tax=Palaemon carinicauda TaxID=392227 RepID=UPI0035B593B6